MDRSKRSPAALIAGGLVLAALGGCGREQTVAGKSAAAFREAQKRGEAFEGAGHSHGHGATTPGGGHAGHHAGAGAAPPEETTAGTMHDHGDHGAATHAEAGHGTAAGAHAGHSARGHGSATHAGGSGSAGHRAQGAEHQSGGHAGHSGMHHGQSPAAPVGQTSGGPTRPDETGHAGHGAMPPAAPSTSAPASALPSPGQPAQTLRPDPLDAPAATSVLDAQRSAEMAQGMAGGGHGSHGVGTYRQVDAGRGPEAHQGSEEQPPGASAHQHGGPATSAPSGQKGAHSHPESSGETAEPAAAVYVCPMHPEVAGKTPGTCPKCGMALVQRRKE